MVRRAPERGLTAIRLLQRHFGEAERIKLRLPTGDAGARPRPGTGRTWPTVWVDGRTHAR